MYKSYKSRSSIIGVTDLPTSARRRMRVQSVVILLLVIALAVSLAVGGRDVAKQRALQGNYLELAQGEAANALSLTAGLSRTAGANSSGTLGKIRSCVYAMEMLNQLNLTGNGIKFVDEGYFTNIYSIIDEYNSKIITGTATTDTLTALNTALSNLNQILLAIGQQ